MNERKKIFLIVLVAIFFFIAIILIFLNSSAEKNKLNILTGNFKIWILQDNKEKFLKILNDFKEKNKSLAGVNFEVETFSDYEEYEDIFSSAILNGVGPDIFVVNNNGETFISKKGENITSDYINLSDFRSDFKTVFSEDLIIKETLENGDEVEYLKGIPVGYETLGIYHNPILVRKNYISSYLSLVNSIKEINDKDSSIIPIGMGNGATVLNSPDIISQMLLLDGIKTLDKEGKETDNSFFNYISFGDTGTFGNGNNYDSKYSELITTGINNYDLFLRGEIAMFVGYPRLIENFGKDLYPKSKLSVSPFPRSTLDNSKTFLNYNYFVLNKDSINKDVGIKLLSYLRSSDGSKAYFKEFPYYLPANSTLEDDMIENKIDKNYNLVLKNFYDQTSELSSFNKGITSLFDKEIIKVLDDASNYKDSLRKFLDFLDCKKKKIINLESLSTLCK